MGSGRQAKQTRGRSDRDAGRATRTRRDVAVVYAPGVGVTREQTRKRRQRPSEQDFWAFMGLDLWNAESDLSIHQILLHWTGAYGFDLPVGRHTDSDGDEAVHLIAGTYEAQAVDGEKRICGDSVTVTSAVLDDHGIGLKLYMRVCEEHRKQAEGASPFEPNETTVWIGQPYLTADGSAGWIVAHGQRDDHEPCAAPELLALLGAADFLIGNEGRPRLPVSEEQFTEHLVEMGDEDRTASWAVVRMDTEPLRASVRSVFGEAARPSEGVMDEHLAFTQSLFATMSRATVGAAEVLFLAPRIQSFAEVVFAKDCPRDGELRCFPPGYDPARYLRDPRRKRLPVSPRVVLPSPAGSGGVVDQSSSDLISLMRDLLRAVNKQRLVALSTWVEAWCEQLDRAEEHGSASRVAAEENAVLRRVLGLPHSAAITEQDALAARDKGFEARLRKLTEVMVEDGRKASVADDERAERLVSQVGSLEQQLVSTLDLVDSLALDRQIAEEERIEAQTQVRSLQVGIQRVLEDRPELVGVLGSLLGLPGADGDADTSEQLIAPPASFEELVARLDELTPWVRFTGDADVTEGLDAQDGLGTIVTTAWDSLLAIADYARAKAEGVCDSGIEGYLADTPPGFRGLPLRRFVPRESAGAMSQFGEERVFPVPTDIEPAGRAIMEAHIRLPRVGMVTPRIHLLDQTHRDGDEAVYVGYIGPHLRTIGTN